MTNRHTGLGHTVRHLMEWAGRSPGGQATDRELIERFNRDGSQEAFAELLARHGALVRAVCRRHLRDAHAADDAFQATFLVLIRKAGRVGWQECIGGWLFEVATRVARKAAGQAVRRRVREGAPAGAASEPVAPDPAPDLTAIQDALEEELRRLPDRFRAPLVLCHLEGLSQDEAARHLRVTEGQLRGRLYRGKARLRERLLRRGFTLPVVLLALSGREARAASSALTASTLRLAGAPPETIPVAVQLLTAGVIREMTTTFTLRALVALLGALGLAAAGLALCPPAADSARPETAPVEVARAAAPLPARPPEIADKQSGFVHSVDAARVRLLVNFDLAAGKGEDAGITADTRVLFCGKAVPLADLKPGMRVDLVYYKGSNVPNEVRASWPRLRPAITAVNAAKRTVGFRFEGEQGVALEATLPLAADAAVTLDGFPTALVNIPPGEATWLTLSSDRQRLIGVAAFSRSYDTSGKVAGYDAATRTLRVRGEADTWVELPVAADAKVVLDGEDAALGDVARHMRVLIRRSADRKTIVGIVAVSGLYELPLPRPGGR
jgi:RNA polymerase sigma factor (sigma-70 family)